LDVIKKVSGAVCFNIHFIQNSQQNIRSARKLYKRNLRHRRHIFWLCDDLSDFVDDIKSRSPNYIAIYTTFINNRTNNYFGSDSLVLSIIHVMGRIMDYLDKLNEQLKQIPSIKNRTVEFVQMYIIAWLKWN
jgi:hypothetical protein